MTAAELRERLIAEREIATPDDELAAAVTRVEWYRVQYAAGKRTVADLTWPDDRPLPTAADLAGSQSKWPADVMAGCARLLTDLLRPVLPALAKTLDIRWELKGAGLAVLADSRWLNNSGLESTYSLLAPIAHDRDRHGVEFVVICIWYQQIQSHKEPPRGNTLYYKSTGI